MPFRAFAPGLDIQGFTPPLSLKDFRLAAFDMECALVNIACADEIAEAVGTRDAVAPLTAAVKRGERVDARSALRRRVALLRGATMADLEEVYTQRLQLHPGVGRLVQACRTAGLKTLLVSDGFTFFADRVRDRLGIDFSRASVLEIRSGPNCGELTGRVATQDWGDLCDGAEKRRMLLETCAGLGITPQQAIAVGDGADDLPMLAEAGLSVAWRARPELREQAMVAIDSGGPDRLLEVFSCSGVVP